MRDTPSHASDHVCLTLRESIQNCRLYRADTTCEADEWTDGWTGWNQYTPNNFVVRRYNNGIMQGILQVATALNIYEIFIYFLFPMAEQPRK